MVDIIWSGIKEKNCFEMNKHSKMKIECVSFLSPPVYFAQWAHMRRFLTVPLSGLDQKSLDNNSYLGKYL